MSNDTAAYRNWKDGDMAAIQSATPPTSEATNAPRLERAQLDFKQWLENKAAMPVGIVLIVSLVLRSAQAWSFGTFNIAALPAPVRGAFDVVTGIGVALGMEMLMSLAGAQWWRLRRQAILASFDDRKSKSERQANKKLLEEDARLYFIFTIGGLLASMGGGMYFAVTSVAHVTIAGIIGAMVVTGAIAFGVFYFGVVHEPRKPDQNRVAQEAVEGQLNEQALMIAGRVGSGEIKPSYVAFLKGVVSPDVARRLDALIPRDNSLEYWDTPKIMRWLGVEGDGPARDIRRKLSRAATDPSLGLRRKHDGRGWEAPQTAILAIFQADIERRMASESSRTLSGDSTALPSRAVSAGASGAGHTTDATRQTSAPTRVTPFHTGARDAAV